MEKLKRCPECGETKSTGLFNQNKRQFDGLATWCRQCEKEYRAANKGKIRALHESWAARNQKCTEPGCDVLTYGTGHTMCPEHQAEAEQAREAAVRERADRLERERQQKYSGRTCQECDGEIPERVNLGALYCGKACRDAVNKRRQHAEYAANRDSYLEQGRAYRLANPRSGTVVAAKVRARRLEVPFELTEADLPEELGNCVICDRELVIGERTVTPSSPTIDRIRPELGYVKGNVLAWVCFSCNSRKHNKTIEQLANGWCGPEWRDFAIRLMAA
jgi:hypothetical protein